MLPEILQNAEDIFKRFLPLLQQTPKPEDDPENYMQNGDRSVCITPILKMSHFEKQMVSQFFQTFVLNFPTRD